jgi:hypothetical protein
MNPAFPNPGDPGGLVDQSNAQGGAGQALRQNTTLSQFGVPIRIGQSAGPGTNCTVFLQTAGDSAYNNATVDLIARIFGHEVIVETFTIDPTIVTLINDFQFTAGGTAADFWCVNITLNNGAVPAANLISSIVAFGVENTAGGGGATGLEPIVLGPKPGGSGITESTDTFPVPDGTSTYLVTGIMRVSVVGGAGEALGDSYAVTVPVTFKSIGGTVTVVPATLAAPDVSTDPSLVGTTFIPVGGIGEAHFSFTPSALLDPYPGTQVEVTVTLLLIGSG